MEFYSGLFVLCYITNIYVNSQNITSNTLSDICKPYILNGHYIEWPSNNTETQYLFNKRFIPKNIIFTRFQMCGNQVFLVSPRYREGVPFTLSRITLNGKDQCFNYVLPYPSLESNTINDYKGLVNAVDIFMDHNGIIWILDTGFVNTLEETYKKESEAKVLGINSKIGKIVYIIPLKSLICNTRTRLHHLVVEYADNKTPIIYIGDGGTRSIIVWNVFTQEGYRVKLPRSPITTCIDFSGEDIFYLVLIENLNLDVNYLYFTYSSSTDMFKIKTKDLQKRINPKCIVSIGRKPCKMVIIGSAYGSVIYFRIKGQNNLFSWDTKDNFLEENMMLTKKGIDCRTITHIDVDNDGVLWELESNIKDFIDNTVGCYGPSIVLSPIYGKPMPLQWLDQT